MSPLTKFFTLTALSCSLLLASCDKKTNPAPIASDSISNKVILDWNNITFQSLGGAANQHSLMNSRMYAMVHAAMFDAVNSTNRSRTGFAYNAGNGGADPEVAAASAAHHILKTNIPSQTNYLDSALNSFLATQPDAAGKTKGIATGIAAANALMALNFNDNGANDPIGQPAPAVKAGDYKNVPPFTFIFAPFWENSKLFALQSKDQFRSSPPPSLLSQEYATAFNEVKLSGKLQSGIRTPEQTLYAKYWYEFAEVGWNRIAAEVVTEKKCGLFQTARIFALLNAAMADGYTAGWDAKLHYNFWRPFTAIREAAIDLNPATDADPTWEPAEPTPPIQDYPSTHSVLGNAAATVLALEFGNQTRFSMKSPSTVPAGISRTFNSFMQAANENADSRVQAGLHFRFSCDAGQKLGNHIGEWTVNTKLKPLQ